jgi:hypothetical protein
VTYSDLLYLCACLAVVAGVALLVGAFFGTMAAIGAALLALSGALLMGARAVSAVSHET